jgi:hypothetical protein
MANFRNDAQGALQIATDALKRLSAEFPKSDSEQLTYALTQAAIGIGYGLLQLVELKDQEIS